MLNCILNKKTLRSVHGVMCEDGYTLSFQPCEPGLGNLIHHHQNMYPDNLENGPPAVLPVEFRRKIILQPSALVHSEPKDLMEKLMQEEQSGSSFNYRCCDEIVLWIVHGNRSASEQPHKNIGVVGSMWSGSHTGQVFLQQRWLLFP